MWTRVAAVVVLLGVQSLVKEVTSIWKEGDGGVQFVFKGQTYNFSSKDCSGGVLFKKPLDLNSVCPHGYFLQRPKGCSSSHEIIIAGEKLPCPELNEKRSVRVQAFIPLTNPGAPTEHTIALYNDPDTLEGFRRYTLRLAKDKGYVGGFNGSGLMVVSNPDKIPETSIGPLCYRGIHGANGAAYKVHIQGNLTSTNEESFFHNGCDSKSLNVNLKDAKKFAMSDGFSKRFARGIASQKSHDTNKAERNSKPRPDKSVTSSFLDTTSDLRETRSLPSSSKTKNNFKTSSDESIVKGPAKSSPTDKKSLSKSPNSKAKQYPKSKKTTGALKVKLKEGIKRVAGKSFVGPEKVKIRKESQYKGIENKSKSKEIINTKRTMEIVGLSAEEESGESGPKNKRAGTIEKNKRNKKGSKKKSSKPSYETSTSEEIIDNNWRSVETSLEVEKLYHTTTDSDLKETIIVEDHARFVSTYFLEMVTIGRSRVGELLSGKNLSDPNAPSLFKNNKSSSLQTDWYALMQKQVKVAETIVPEIVMPRGIFQDALNAFSFMFRNLPDRQVLQNLKGILDSLSKCQKWYASNPIKIDFDTSATTACPPKVGNVSEKPSFVWNPETDSPQDLSGQSEVNFPNQEPIRFRHKTIPGNTNLIVQLMFTAMDIVNVACFKRFQPSGVNLHSRMTYYLMSNVFLSPEVHEYWKQGDISPNVFVSLLPNWNSGKSLKKMGEELDMIRVELRKATVYRSWITTDPNQYSMKRISVENQDNGNEISYESQAQKKARHHVEELIRAFLYLEEPTDGTEDPDDDQSTAVEEKESQEPNSTEVSGNDKDDTESAPDSPVEESAVVPAPQESASSTRNKRDTNREKLRHREIWNGLAYCLSLTEEFTRKGETIQLGIHPSLELLQTQIVC